MRNPTISPPPPQKAPRVHLPDGSRSVQSPWVWRGFFFLSLIAFGLVLSFLIEGRGLLAIAWTIIGTGWFTVSMWLWRKNVLLDRAEYEAARAKQSISRGRRR